MSIELISVLGNMFIFIITIALLYWLVIPLNLLSILFKAFLTLSVIFISLYATEYFIGIHASLQAFFYEDERLLFTYRGRELMEGVSLTTLAATVLFINIVLRLIRMSQFNRFGYSVIMIFWWGIFCLGFNGYVEVTDRGIVTNELFIKNEPYHYQWNQVVSWHLNDKGHVQLIFDRDGRRVNYGFTPEKMLHYSPERLEKIERLIKENVIARTNENLLHPELEKQIEKSAEKAAESAFSTPYGYQRNSEGCRLLKSDSVLWEIMECEKKVSWWRKIISH